MAAKTPLNTCPGCGGLLNPRGPCPHCGWPEKKIPTLELTNDELRILTATLLRRAMINVFSKQDDPKVGKTVDEVSQKVARFLVDNKLADPKQPVVFQVRIGGGVG